MIQKLAAVLVLIACAHAAHAQQRPPNIVIVFCDDLGYGDVMQYADGYDTPHLDALVRQGITLTSFYVAQPVCSASRAGLLTGCYPNRIGIQGALGPNANHGLHADETTIAEICKKRGYATAIYGKWHLGHREPFLPTNHGFDEFIGIPYSNDMWPLHPDVTEQQRKRKQGYPDLPLYHNTTIINHEITIEDQQQFTKYFTERAVQFIEEHADQPFFLYLPHPMPHVPIYTSQDFDDKTGAGLYADVISELDWSVGRITTTLERLGIEDNTIVVFTSDNGPWLSYGNHAGTTGPLREGKGTTWDGGVRTPCVIRWPGVIPAGITSAEPVMTIDLLPTICEVLDVPLPPRPVDGVSILPLLRADPDAPPPHDVLYFYYHDNNLQALRAGKWKLYLPHRYRTMQGSTPGKDGLPGKYNYRDMPLELYDLEADISETTNLAETNPRVVEQLMLLVDDARADMGDKLTNHPGTHRREPGRWSKPQEQQGSPESE